MSVCWNAPRSRPDSSAHSGCTCGNFGSHQHQPSDVTTGPIFLGPLVHKEGLWGRSIPVRSTLHKRLSCCIQEHSPCSLAVMHPIRRSGDDVTLDNVLCVLFPHLPLLSTPTDKHVSTGTDFSMAIQKSIRQIIYLPRALLC